MIEEVRQILGYNYTTNMASQMNQPVPKHLQSATTVEEFMKHLKAKNTVLLKTEVEDRFRDSYTSLFTADTFDEFRTSFIAFFALFTKFSDIIAPFMILPTLRHTVPRKALTRSSKRPGHNYTGN